MPWGVPGGNGSGDGGLRTSVPFGDMMFLGRLRDVIQENFHAPRVTRDQGKRVAVVYFKILKNGDIIDISVVESSGHKGIDRAAVKAVEAVRPFDPLPPGTSDLGVTCDFVAE